MTSVLLVCDPCGALKSCSASGHAGLDVRGRDIVCAAESHLFRTAMKLLEETEGLILLSDASSRGSLAFSVEIEHPSSALNERLKCTADFIRTGIKMLSEEYPEHVCLREITE